MTIRDKHIAQKKKEIEKIARKQKRLIKKAAAIPTKPSKKQEVNFRRLAKRFAIAQQINSLELQKQLIIAQPLPKHDTGGVIAGNMAIFAETGPEYITAGNFRIYPNPLVKEGEPLVVISESSPIDVNAFKALDLMPKGWLRSFGEEIKITLP